MDTTTILEAIFLGMLEGLTEFIPVSSTGHLLLAGHFLGFESTGKAFEVLIQLGAILAILTVYSGRLWGLARSIPHNPHARRFILGVLIAFLPAVVIGLLAHDFIKTVLFESPLTICVMLILGGVVLLFVDRFAPEPVYHNPLSFPLSMYLKIGLFQCLAMIPGTSRSGATIVGSMLMRADKRAAAEFSFYLAMPTMLGAFALDLFKNRDILSAADLPIIAAGFVSAFVVAVLVVRSLLAYVSQYGYALFGWWRIVVGTAGLIGLWLTAA